MPPRAAEFAVGDGFQSDGLLRFDNIADLPILDFAELVGADPALRPRGTRVLQGRRPQKTSDLIGAIRRSARHDGNVPVMRLARWPRKTRRPYHARRGPSLKTANRERNLGRNFREIVSVRKATRKLSRADLLHEKAR